MANSRMQVNYQNNAQVDNNAPAVVPADVVEDDETPDQKHEKHMLGLLTALCNDPTVRQMFVNHKNEFERDCVLLDYFLTNNNYQYCFSDPYAEIHKSIYETRLIYVKSQVKAKGFSDQAVAEFNKKHYKEAIHKFGASLRYLPDDKKQKADLCLMRARCFLFLNDKESAAINIDLALLACKDIESDLTEEEKKIIEKKELGWTNPDPNCFLTSINPSIKTAVKYDQLLGSATTLLMADEDIDESQPILYNYPHIYYNQQLLKSCPGCQRNIKKECNWPCNGCSSVVYCSEKCRKKNETVHKIECGFTKYINQRPLFAIMIRAYAHNNLSPVTLYDSTRNYIEEYMNRKKGNNSKDNKDNNDNNKDNKKGGGKGSSHSDSHKKLEVGTILNCFRQIADERRVTYIKKFDQYYANMIHAIEFLCLYQHLRNNLEFDPFIKNNFENPRTFEPFAWAESYKDTPISLIAKIFADVKRFSSISTANLINSLAGKETSESQKYIRRLVVPAELFILTHGQLRPNVVATYDKFGQIKILSRRKIKKGEFLILDNDYWYEQKIPVPEAQIPEAQIPEAQIPEAQIPEAPIPGPSGAIPKKQSKLNYKRS